MEKQNSLIIELLSWLAIFLPSNVSSQAMSGGQKRCLLRSNILLEETLLFLLINKAHQAHKCGVSKSVVFCARHYYHPGCKACPVLIPVFSRILFTLIFC